MELKPGPFCGNEDVGIAVGAYCNYENIFSLQCAITVEA